MYKTDYERYVEWCKVRNLEPVTKEVEEQYGIWNSIEHLGLADKTEELV